MIKLRTASALAVGTVAALALGGTALAAGTDDPASSAGAISLKDAKAIAIKAAGGGRVTDIERDTEHGKAVWDVEVRRGAVEHDIDVDRATGDVLRHRSERDDDSDDRHDDRDDHDDRYDD